MFKVQEGEIMSRGLQMRTSACRVFCRVCVIAVVSNKQVKGRLGFFCETVHSQK